MISKIDDFEINKIELPYTIGYGKAWVRYSA